MKCIKFANELIEIPKEATFYLAKHTFAFYFDSYHVVLSKMKKNCFGNFRNKKIVSEKCLTYEEAKSRMDELDKILNE